MYKKKRGEKKRTEKIKIKGGLHWTTLMLSCMYFLYNKHLEFPTFLWWCFSGNTTFRTIEPIVIGKLIPEYLIVNRMDRKKMNILLKM